MTNKEDTIKIIIAGAGGVGKSSLLQRYVKNEFIADYKLTVGVAFMFKEVIVDDRKMKFQLWDLGGQDRFRFLQDKYFMNSLGVLYVYDLTMPGTILNIKEFVELNKHGNPRYDRCVQFLIGNKMDLCNEDVTSNMLSHFLESNPSYVFQKSYKTSAKTGDNVEDIFKDLGSLILEQRRLYKK